MACKICNRNSCTESFHSIEQQQEHENQYGRFEDMISELKEKIGELQKENDIMYNILNEEQVKEFEKENQK